MLTISEIFNAIMQHSTCAWTKGFLQGVISNDESLQDKTPLINKEQQIHLDALSLIKNNPTNFIHCIKEIRAIHGLGLKEAKEACDIARAELGKNSPPF